MATRDCSLIVVSNRLPFVIRVEEDGTAVRVQTAGGLATAFGPVLLESKGIWVGYAGGFEGEIPDGNAEGDLPSEQIMPVNLTKEEVDKYYETISNGLLWPVFHSMPEKAEFEGAHMAWDTYVAVNQEYSIILLSKDCPDASEKDGHFDLLPGISFGAAAREI